MLDIVYKLFRKALPHWLYRVIQLSPIGRATYCERFETYKAIVESYREFTHLEFKNKIVAEIGTGNQFFTALLFLQYGAAKVIVVEPKLSISSIAELLEENIRMFKSHDSTFELSKEDLKDRIVVASDIGEINTEYNDVVDVLLSHHVLEHVPSIDLFMSHCKRLLSTTGISYNFVDLSDHTYHICHKYRLTVNIWNRRSLYHLQYSDKLFNVLNDSKCFMNRILLPLYLETAKKYHLAAEVSNRHGYRKVHIHHDILEGFASRNEDDLYITSFHIMLTKDQSRN